MDALKERIALYWAQRAPAFREQRLRELSSEKRDRWLAELKRYLPDRKNMEILDIGTGAGFFALLLSPEGHAVTGIDLTEEMIREAEACAKRMKLSAAFQVMDAEQPDFASGRFDAIITRNLTWTLPRLEKAYSAWYDLLKPGGVLVNFDADYCRVSAETETPVLPDDHAHKLLDASVLQENDAITMELSAWQQPRPQWDVELLLGAGFEQVTVDTGVWKRIYSEIDEFYNPVPIFTIAAYRTE